MWWDEATWAVVEGDGRREPLGGPQVRDRSRIEFRVSERQLIDWVHQFRTSRWHGRCLRIPIQLSPPLWTFPTSEALRLADAHFAIAELEVIDWCPGPEWAQVPTMRLWYHWTLPSDVELVEEWREPAAAVAPAHRPGRFERPYP